MRSASVFETLGNESEEVSVYIGWSAEGAVYKKGVPSNPSYSRSGGSVYLIEGRYFVPGIGSEYPARWFDTLEGAWGYCESAYYSFN